MTHVEHLHDSLTRQHLTFRQTSRDTGGARLAIEVRLEPGGRVPRHLHVRQDERLTVLSGSIVVRIGRDQRTMHAGDVIDVPRRTVHVVHNDGPGDARFLLDVRPARRMEAAMRGLFAVSSIVAPLSNARRRLRQR